jgi:GTP-binding protein
LRYAPVISITAKDSRNVQSAIDLAQSLFKKSRKHAGTAEVNKVLEAVKDYRGPRVRGRRQPKIFYGAQVATAPPAFAIFVNDPALFPADYRRYVEKALREVLGFEEIPLRLFFRARQKSEKP